MSTFFSWDTILFQFINQFAGQWSWLDAVAIFLAKYSEYLFLLLICVVFFVKRKDWGWKMFFGMLATGFLSRIIITEGIRIFYHRPRPFEVLHVIQLLNHGPEASFPSGHAAFYFALAWFLFFQNRKLGLFFLVAVSLMTLARIFVGIHYPVDILAGFLIAFICAKLVYRLLPKA